jgi:hypothetical protein
VTGFLSQGPVPHGGQAPPHEESPADTLPEAPTEVPPPSGWRVGRVFGVPLYAQPSGLAFFALLALLTRRS